MEARSVYWYAKLDFNQVEKQIKNFESQARQLKVTIAPDLTGIDKLNKTAIKPVVDHKPLEELNKHLDKKLRHYKELNNYFKRNPLTIRTKIVNESGGSTTSSSSSLGKNDQYLQAIAKNTDNAVKIGVKQNNSIAKLASANKKGYSEINKSIKANKPSLLMGTLAQAIGTSFSGVTSAIGSQASQNLGVSPEEIGRGAVNVASVLAEKSVNEIKTRIQESFFKNIDINAQLQKVRSLIDKFKEGSPTFASLVSTIEEVNQAFKGTIDTAERRSASERTNEQIRKEQFTRQGVRQLARESSEVVSASRQKISGFRGQQTSLRQQLEEQRSLVANRADRARSAAEKTIAKLPKGSLKGQEIALETEKLIQEQEEVFYEIQQAFNEKIEELEQKIIKEQQKLKVEGQKMVKGVKAVEKLKATGATGSDQFKIALDAATGGKNIPKELTPSVRPLAPGQKTAGSYVASANVIYLDPKLLAKLEQNIALSVSEMSALIHELTHAANIGFGTMEEKFSNTTDISPQTIEERQHIEGFLKNYTKLGRNREFETTRGLRRERDEETSAELNAFRQRQRAVRRMQEKRLVGQAPELQNISVQLTRQLQQKGQGSTSKKEVKQNIDAIALLKSNVDELLNILNKLDAESMPTKEFDKFVKLFALVKKEYKENAIAAENLLKNAKAASKSIEDSANVQKQVDKYLSRVKEVADKFRGASAQMKGLKGNEQKALAEAIFKSSKYAMAEARAILQKIPKDQRMSHPISSRIGQLSRVNKSAKRILEQQGVNTDELEVEIKPVIISDPWSEVKETLNEGLKDTIDKVYLAGQNFVEGIKQGIGLKTPELIETATDSVDKMHKGVLKELDIQSPSKKGEKTGKDYILGIILGLSKMIPKLDEIRKKVVGRIHEKHLGNPEDYVVGSREESKSEIKQEIDEYVSHVDDFRDKTKEQFTEISGIEFTPKFSEIFKEIGKGIKEQNPLFSDFANKIREIGRAGLQLLVLNKLGNLFSSLADGSFELALKLENLERNLTFTTAKNGANELEKISNQANDLGVDFLAAAEGYRQFTISTMGTNLSSQVEEMFDKYTKGFAAFALGAEQQEGALLALSQMANKGVVSSEELRQQLSDRGVPAINMAARAYGMLTEEFNHLLNSGQILSEELLPALASQMEKETALGLFDTMQSTQAEVNRLGNNITELKATLGEGLLAGANIGLPILNKGLNFANDNVAILTATLTLLTSTALVTFVKTLMAVNLHTGIFNGLLAVTKASLKTLAPSIFIVDAGLSKMGKTMAITSNIFTKAVLPFAGLVALLTVVIKQFQGLASAITAPNKALIQATNATESYINALKELKGIQEETKALTSVDAQIRGEDFGLHSFKDLANRQKWVEEFQEAWGILSFQTMRDMRAFIVNAENIEKALDGTMALIAEAKTASNQVDIGGGFTVGDGLTRDTIQKVQQRLGQLREESTAISLQIEIAGGRNDQKLIQELRDKKKLIQNEIDKVIDTALPSAVTLDKQLENIKSQVATIQNLIEEETGKGNLEIVKQYEFQLQNVLAVEKEVQKAVDLKNEAIKKTNKLYSEQVKLGEMMTRAISNTNFATESNAIVQQVSAMQARLRGELSSGELDLVKQNIRTVELDIKFKQSSQAFTEFENAFIGRLEAFNPEVKAQLSSELGVDNLEQAIKNKTVSPEAIASLFSTANEGLANILGNPNDIKAILELAQQYLTTWKEVKQTQLDYTQSVIDENQAVRQRQLEVREFARQISDFRFTYADFFRNRQRQLEDFETQLVRMSLSSQKEARNIIEQYQSLERQLTNNLRQTRGQLESVSRDLERQTTTNNLRELLDFGENSSLMGSLITLFDDITSQANSLQDQEYQLDQERLRIEEERVTLSKQIRDLNEQAFDHELTRVETLRNLLRQQEDFVIDQERSWLQITQQIEDMEQRSKEMGFSFDSIAELMNNINTTYADIYSQLMSLQGQMVGANNFNQPTTGISATSSQQEKLAYTVRYLMSKGLEDYHAAAITGNLAQESNLNPYAVNPTSGATGLAQWLGSRLDKMPKQTGNYLTDFNNQLDYIFTEFNTTERRAYNLFIKTKDVSEAVRVFGDEFERMGQHEANYVNRYKQAQKALVQARMKPSTEVAIGFNSKINEGLKAVQQFNGVINSCARAVKLFNSILGYNTKEMDATANSAKRMGTVMSDWSKLQPGDIIGWDKTPNFGDEHVGTFLGGKNVLHQSGSRGRRVGIFPDLDYFKQQPGAYFVRQANQQANRQIQVSNQPLPTRDRFVSYRGREMTRSQMPITAITTSDIDYKGILENLVKNNKIPQDQIEQLSIKLSQNDLKEIQKQLESLKINLFEEQTSLIELRGREQAERWRQKALADEQKIYDTRKNIEQTIANQVSQARQLSLSNQDILRNAKGYLTIDEKVDIKRNEINEKYKAATKAIEENIKAMEALTTEQGRLNELREKFQDQLDNALLSDKSKENIKAILETVVQGEQELRTLMTQLEKDGERIAAQLPQQMQRELDKEKLTAIVEFNGNMASLYSQFAELTRGVTQTPLPLRLEGESLTLNNNIDKLVQEIKTTLSMDDVTEQQKENLNQMLERLEKNRDLMVEISQTDIIRQEQLEMMTQAGNFFGTIGDLKAKFDPFGGNQEQIIAGVFEVQSTFLELNATLDELSRTMPDVFSPEIVTSYRAQLAELQQSELAQLQLESSQLYQNVAGPLEQAISQGVTGLIKGTTSIKQVLGNLLDSVASSLMQFAAKMVTNSILKNVLGMFSGFSGGGTGGGLVGSLIGGNSFGIGSVPSIPTFAKGGEVFEIGGYVNNDIVPFSKKKRRNAFGNPAKSSLKEIVNYSFANQQISQKTSLEHYALGLGVADALKREGSGAVPIVAHKGEHLLSAKTGDAQAFRQLLNSGMWDRIKQMPAKQNITNFKGGGMVGSYTRAFEQRNKAMSQPVTQSQGVVMNITTPDVNSFRESRSAIAQEEAIRQQQKRRFI